MAIAAERTSDLFIDGVLTGGGAGRFATVNPATEEVLGTAAKIVRFNSKRESEPVAKPESSASGKISRRWVRQQLQSDLRRTAASVVEEFRK